MVKVFVPMVAKLVRMVFSKAAIEVMMAMSAPIPKPITNKVNMDRSLLEEIDLQANFMYSLNGIWIWHKSRLKFINLHTYSMKARPKVIMIFLGDAAKVSKLFKKQKT